MHLLADKGHRAIQCVSLFMESHLDPHCQCLQYFGADIDLCSAPQTVDPKVNISANEWHSWIVACLCKIWARVCVMCSLSKLKSVSHHFGVLVVIIKTVLDLNMDTALNPTAKNELQETVERMEEKWHIFHPHPSNQYLVWCFKWERNYFDIGSTAYFCCHGVLPVVRAAVDRVNVFICINTVFLLIPRSEWRASFEMWHLSRKKTGRDKLYRTAKEMCMVFIYAFFKRAADPES